MGQETWQVMGKAVERQAQKELIISDEDIDTVMQQAHITRESAIHAIRKHNGDLAAAILEFTSEQVYWKFSYIRFDYSFSF